MRDKKQEVETITLNGRVYVVNNDPTYPKTRKVAPKVDPLLKKAIARTSMLLFLNELKPTKSPKKLAELEKSTLLLKKFIG